MQLFLVRLCFRGIRCYLHAHDLSPPHWQVDWQCCTPPRQPYINSIHTPFLMAYLLLKHCG